jgi:hypothetical protein
MQNPLATSTCLDGCDLSWTTGMPVHPEPATTVKPNRLPRKDLRELVVLAAVCVVSTIVFVPPLVGVVQSAPEQSAPEAPVLASRELHGAAPLVIAQKHQAVTLVGASATIAPVVRVASATRREPSRTARRPLAAKIGRALAGNGRYRVQPFPRPSE